MSERVPSASCDQVVVRIEPAASKETRGLSVLDSSGESVTGTVVSVGPDIHGLPVGARVLFPRSRAAYTRSSGIEYAVVCERVLYGLLPGDEAK